MRSLLLAALAVAASAAHVAAAGGGAIDFGMDGGGTGQPDRCFNLTFDELSWAAGDTTYFTDDASSSDYFTTHGALPYGGLEFSNLQIKSNASSMWSPNGQASPPNMAVSWTATPIVALAQRGAFRPVSVVAAVQAFFPLLAGNQTRPPATLTVWAARAGKGGPEFAACAAAALPMPATPADGQIGAPVAVDLSGCGTAVALVFGLSERTAFFDPPNMAFLSDTYFTLDDLSVCSSPSPSSSSSIAPPPPSIYLQSPPLGQANRRRRARQRRRLAQAASNATAPGTTNASAPTLLPAAPLPGSPGAVAPPPRPGYVAGGGQKTAQDAAAMAVVAAALTTAPKATPGGAGAGASAASRAAATAAAAAAGASPSSPSSPSSCFTDGFDALSWRPTVNHTLDGDAYVSFYKPLEDGAGLAWVNLAVVRDAAPPPAATSRPHWGRPRFPGPVYAFATAGAFRPVAVSVAPACQPGSPGTPVDPALCPGPPAPPPVFEVAAIQAGGSDGVTGARLTVCATAALGAPPKPGAGAPAGTGDPVTIDLSACGPAVLGLRFRLVPPFPGREISWGVDDLILCPVPGRGGGGARGVRPPERVELPVVDPAAWRGGA